MTHWRASLIGIVAAVVGLAWYLYDPPWLATTTFGIRPARYEEAGTRYQWAEGSATFYVPRETRWMTLRMRAVYPGPSGRPVRVRVSVDGEWLADIRLDHVDEWLESDLPLPQRSTWRRTRRIDLNVDRTVGDRNLGVELADAELR